MDYFNLTKAETLKLLREIKNKNCGNLSQADYEWVREAFEFLHPDLLEEKIDGRELTGIAVKRCPEHYNTSCFYLQFADGTETDISMNGKRSGRNDILQAMRVAIMPEIWKFKKSATFPTKCPITGMLIEFEEADVDHYDLTFLEVANAFIEKMGGVNELLPHITKDTDNQACARFTDKDTEKAFVEYHNANTHLRIVSQFANRSILKKKHFSI